MTGREGQLALRAVAGVRVAYWDPLRRTGRWGQGRRRSRPLRNFGDMLGPPLVARLVAALGRPAPAPDRRGRLLAIGSILHLARAGDVVWGAGLSPKGEAPTRVAAGLDLRAVRGPVTRELLAGLGIAAPAVFGDPALLLPAVLPLVARGEAPPVILPNLNELERWRGLPAVVNPRDPWRSVLRRIVASRLVVGSSLHGIIVAEAYGVPARAVRSEHEGAAKYADYYRATGRDPDAEIAQDVPEAIARGGAPGPVWDPRPLLRAFPMDLWGAAPDPDAIEAIALRLPAGRAAVG